MNEEQSRKMLGEAQMFIEEAVIQYHHNVKEGLPSEARYIYPTTLAVIAQAKAMIVIAEQLEKLVGEAEATYQSMK